MAKNGLSLQIVVDNLQITHVRGIVLETNARANDLGKSASADLSWGNEGLANTCKWQSWCAKATSPINSFGMCTIWIPLHSQTYTTLQHSIPAESMSWDMKRAPVQNHQGIYPMFTAMMIGVPWITLQHPATSRARNSCAIPEIPTFPLAPILQPTFARSLNGYGGFGRPLVRCLGLSSTQRTLTSRKTASRSRSSLASSP